MAFDAPPSPFSPIRSRRTFEEISHKIKRLIFKGVLKPGDKLPSELELARQFSVGRQSVREALRLLELSGFLTVQKGAAGGAVVENTILNTVSGALADAIQMGDITIEGLTVARLGIERLVLEHVLDYADGSDIDALQQNVHQARAKIQAGNQAFSENIAFHRILAKASKNHVYVIVVESIMAVVADFLSRLEPDVGKSRRVVEYHAELVDAISRRDATGALMLLERHLRDVETWL